MMEKNTDRMFFRRLMLWTLNAMFAWGVVGGCLVDAPVTFLGFTGFGVRLVWTFWKGLLLGIVISVGQWGLLRDMHNMTWWWIPLTSLAYGVAYPLAFSISTFFSWTPSISLGYEMSDFSQERLSLSCVVYFLLVGFISSWIQWGLLQRYLIVEGVRTGLLWFWGTAAAWVIGYFFFYLIRTVFGNKLVSNVGMGLVVGMISGLVLLLLHPSMLENGA
jgi:hypothetical protein